MGKRTFNLVRKKPHSRGFYYDFSISLSIVITKKRQFLKLFLYNKFIILQNLILYNVDETMDCFKEP